MRTSTSYISKFLLIIVLFSAVPAANAAAKSGGRLIVIRVANFGWNIAANLKIDGQPLGTLSRVAVTITESRPGVMF
jgi:hypothetical protein